MEAEEASLESANLLSRKAQEWRAQELRVSFTALLKSL
jgi:hypothetical protein